MSRRVCLDNFPAILLRKYQVRTRVVMPPPPRFHSSSRAQIYTTLHHQVTCEREIKRSKFIAIAAPITNEVSAQSFLSEFISDTWKCQPVVALIPVSLEFHLHLEQSFIRKNGYIVKTCIIDYKWRMDQNFRCTTMKENIFYPMSKVRDPRATHNCWAYKLGDQFRCNDDGEPSGTAGKPIYSAIASSGLDKVMVVVIRHFGGIKLGTGGLVRAYGGVASECLKDAPTFLVKSKVSIHLEVPFDLLGRIYHLLEPFHVDDIKQDYESVVDGVTLITFRVDHDKVESLESTIKATGNRQVRLQLQ